MEALAEEEAEPAAAERQRSGEAESSPASPPRRADSLKGRREQRQRPLTNAGRYYYFVGVRLEAEGNSCSAAERSPFVGLQLGLLLGKGSYGRVYKGYYHGRVVAVKARPPLELRCRCKVFCLLGTSCPCRKAGRCQIKGSINDVFKLRFGLWMVVSEVPVPACVQVCDSSKVRRTAAGTPVEVEVTARLAHPNLVRTLEAASVARSPGHSLDWELRTVQEDDECVGSSSNNTSSNNPSAPTTQQQEAPRSAYCEEAAADGPAAATEAPAAEAEAPQQASAGAEPGPDSKETWLLLEYCDQGSLVVSLCHP